MSEIQEALEELRAAIENEGPHPLWHQQTMQRHRQEWPILWRAIDRLRDVSVVVDEAMIQRGTYEITTHLLGLRRTGDEYDYLPLTPTLAKPIVRMVLRAALQVTDPETDK
jgi:hypothetical protein